MQTENTQFNRLKTVAGTVNFRDVGGYRAGESTTKWGELFRADALHQLTPEGKQSLLDLGVKKVVDLRDDFERKSAPDALPVDVELIENPIFKSAMSHVDRKLDIAQLTELIFFEHAETVTAAVSILAKADAPTVVHCTAGKDRTGAVIAATLGLVGVDRDDVLADYEATQKRLQGEWLENHLATLRRFNMDITPEVLGLVSTSPLAVMDRALKMVDHEFGSMTDYLLQHGLSESNINVLYGRLVS